MSLRTQVLRGGTYLAIRQGTGILLSLVGSILLARWLGPATFGLYAGTYSLYNYAWLLCQWGVTVYLIRHATEPTAEDYHQAFTLLLGLGTVGGLAGLALLPWVGEWLGVTSVWSVGLALFAALPVHLTNLVPLARLERALDYRRVALVELAAQVAYYAVALPLAATAAGVWALVAGFWAQVLISAGLLYGLTGYRPRWFYRRELAGRMARFGFGFAGASWVWHLRTLINPLLVGHWLGTAAVGHVALAIRLVDTLSFIRNATWRIALAALARLQQDRARLAQAIGDGMWWQLLALGPVLVVVGALAPWWLPALFGEEWRPVLTLYPFIALGALINAGFNLHASTLAVLGHNGRATGIATALVAALVTGAVVALRPLGLLGYGVAELAALPVYALYHVALRREVAGIPYPRVLLWWLVFGVALFAGTVGWWAALTPLALWLLPSTRQELIGLWRTLRGST